MIFKNRRDAGKRLAQKLQAYKRRNDVLVLALPGGGVPVGFEVAHSLHVPLDVFIVRELGLPGHEEVAMGAIASGGITIMNEKLVNELLLSQATIDMAKQIERKELARRESLYRRGRQPYQLKNKQVILVDDGLATGASMRAAAIAVRESGPAKIIVAVPVATEDTCTEFRSEVDETVCFETPPQFRAVGAWYEDFARTSDDEVQSLLDVSACTWRAA